MRFFLQSLVLVVATLLSVRFSGVVLVSLLPLALVTSWALITPRLPGFFLSLPAAGILFVLPGGFLPGVVLLLVPLLLSFFAGMTRLQPLVCTFLAIPLVVALGLLSGGSSVFEISYIHLVIDFCLLLLLFGSLGGLAHATKQ